MTTIDSSLSSVRVLESSLRRREDLCTWASPTLLAAAVFALVSAWVASFRGGGFWA